MDTATAAETAEAQTSESTGFCGRSMAAEGDVRFGREMENWEKRGGNFGLGLRMRRRKIEGQIEKCSFVIVVKGILITL